MLCLFFFNDTATTEIYTLSLHDALPIYRAHRAPARDPAQGKPRLARRAFCRHGPRIQKRTRHNFRIRADDSRNCGECVFRSEEHTSELQSQSNLVCRLLLEKKKTKIIPYSTRLILDFVCSPASMATPRLHERTTSSNSTRPAGPVGPLPIYRFTKRS